MQHPNDYSPDYDYTSLKYYDRNYKITGEKEFCSISGNYSLATVPSPGASILWSSLAATGVVDANSPTSTSTTLQKNFDGFTKLRATVTHSCGAVFTNDLNLRVGFPYFPQLAVGPYGADTVWPYSYNHFTISVPLDYGTVDGYYWSITPSGWNISSGQYTNDLYVQSGATGSNRVVEIYVTACGVTYSTYRYVVVDPAGGWIPDFTAGDDDTYLKTTPNPARNFAQISLERKGTAKSKSTPLTISEVRIADKIGNLKRQFRFSNTQLYQRVSVEGLTSDIYTVSAFDGHTWFSSKLIIAK